MPLEGYETMQVIREGLKNFDFASAPAVVKTAQSLTKDVDRLTISELASLISKDPLATAKVLDISNKGIGQDRVAKDTLDEALLAVGFNKLKQAAFQLLDMESAKEKLRHPEQQEASAIALCSCNIAEEVYKNSYWQGSKLKVEDIYIATVLRSYGRILLSSFLIDEYRAALGVASVKGEKQAFRDIFGITPIELTHDILMETKLPKSMVKTLKLFDGSIFENPHPTKGEELQVLSEFSLQLTVKMFDFRVKASKIQKEVTTIVEDFDKYIKMSFDDTLTILSDVGEVLTEIDDKYKIEAVPPHIPKAIECRLSGQDLPAVTFGGGKKKAQKAKPPEEIIETASKEYEFVAKKKPLNFEKLFGNTVKLLHETLRMCESAVFVDQDGDEFKPKVGEGDLFKYIQKRKVSISQDDKNVIGMCAKNKCDALVFDTMKPNVQKLIPTWMAGEEVNSLLCIYINLENPVVMVFMRRNGEQIQLPGKLIKAISTLKEVLYMAVEDESLKPAKMTLDLRTFNNLLKEVTA